jgi:HAD superfamily hydrolase (TIGR01549 family)
MRDFLVNMSFSDIIDCMIKALVSDFSRVLLLPKDTSYLGGLNALHKILSGNDDYNLESHFELNQELLDFYKTLGDKKINLYIFTTGSIQEHSLLESKIKNVFKQVFRSVNLGFEKTDILAYKTISRKIGVNPEEILYIDDNHRNVNTAKEAGMKTIKYESNEQAIKEIRELL